MRAELLALLLAACAPPEAPAAPDPVEATAEPVEPAESPVSLPDEDEIMPLRPAIAPYSRRRDPAVAGSWYSDDPTRLAAEIDGYLAGPAPDCAAQPLALVAPHAGYRWSGATAGVAYRQVRGCNISRVWVLGPAHRVRLSGVGLYDTQAFRTPLGDLPVDQAVFSRLREHPDFQVLHRGDQGEHSLEIQLPLLQRALGAFELVPLLVGRVEPAGAARIADALRAEVGPGDLVVVSSDFTHYGPRFGYTPFTEELAGSLYRLDHGAWAHVAEPDLEALHAYLEETGATICGRNALKILAAMVPDGTVGTELAYTTSGEMTGDWSNSVSYLAGRLDGPAWSGTGPATGGARFVSHDTGQALLALARASIDHYFETGEALSLTEDQVPEDARQQLGAFVTLTHGGRLRGCIGEIQPRRAAWEAVVERAVDAAIHDSRFPPVTAEEWEDLDLDVTLLGPSWQVPRPDDVILGRHGIVVRAGFRRATFLPQVAPEQGWDRATTLARLRRKAGIGRNERVSIDVYEAQVILPEGH